MRRTQSRLSTFHESAPVLRVLLRATANGHSQWLRVPPPVTERSVQIAPPAATVASQPLGIVAPK
jgi:hypothetical protein